MKMSERMALLARAIVERIGPKAFDEEFAYLLHDQGLWPPVALMKLYEKYFPDDQAMAERGGATIQ